MDITIDTTDSFSNTLPSTTLNKSSKDPLTSLEKRIPLSQEDRVRMYLPWKYSIIIKLQGKQILHQILRKKAQELWKVKENLPLIDLGADYYIAKLQNKDSMHSVLQNGPWFIFGHFLSCQRREPNFVASEAKQSFTAIWLRLPNLPTEFYDGFILQKIDNSIGRLLKIDACTSATLRGRYARLCVELPMDHPVAKFIYIEDHKQYIEYEGGKNTLHKCVGC
ncbi:uncharacterized protein [Nicotiana tomentosiformis]|uniref:uncharacterized protein n=1 Tax=Nicotiana tomentosiformis TaxID=4098 RepID=UPI00388CE013